MSRTGTRLLQCFNAGAQAHKRSAWAAVGPEVRTGGVRGLFQKAVANEQFGLLQQVAQLQKALQVHHA